jgi:hypothetical protein
MENISELMSTWEQHALEIETAVNERNFKSFKKAFQEGSKCFQKLRQMIQDGGRVELKANEEVVKQAVNRWVVASQAVPEWMKEIQGNLRQIKNSKVRGKKLGNAYNYMNKTGSTLRIKAR